jgi:hypothetical protein
LRPIGAAPIFHVCHYAIWAAYVAHGNASKIVARMVQAGDDVQRNWINGGEKGNGYRRVAAFAASVAVRLKLLL